MTLATITYPLTILHKPEADPYPVWGGIEGVRAAAAAGATALDVDGQADETGQFHAVHWATLGEHGWKSPYGGLMGASIREMTAEQVATFTFRHDGVEYKIHPMREVFATAAARNITVCLEVKSMGDFERLREEAESTACRVIVMTLPHLGGKNAGYARLAAAKRAGLPTMVLLNDTRYAAGVVPPDAWQHVDYVKGGTAAWRVHKPAHVITLGGGSKYGISVSPGNARAVTARLRRMWPATPTTPPVTPPPVKPPTTTPAKATAQKVIDYVKTQVGYHEGRSGGHWNNVEKYAAMVPGMSWVSTQHQPWCVTFAAAATLQAGLKLGVDFPNTASCDMAGDWFKARNRWSEYPAIGAWVLFGTPRDLSHCGVVVAMDADTITTVEGNTNTSGSREGDGVYLKKHARRDVRVVGYGYPKYPEGITSADPAWPRAGSVVVGPVVPSAPPVTPPLIVPPRGWKPTPDIADLSRWQTGRLDFAAAKRAGLRAAVHKATQGTSIRDPFHNRRRTEVGAAKLVWGAYHFAEPSSRAKSATAQVKYHLAAAKPKDGDMRGWLDLERTGGLGIEGLTQWAEEYADAYKAEVGKPPILYTNYPLRRDPGCFLIRARYNNDMRLPVPLTAWVRWTAWQFTNGKLGIPNQVPGLGHVDLSTLFPGFDFNRLIL